MEVMKARLVFLEAVVVRAGLVKPTAVKPGKYTTIKDAAYRCGYTVSGLQNLIRRKLVVIKHDGPKVSVLISSLPKRRTN